MKIQQILKTAPLRAVRISTDPDTGPLSTVAVPVSWDDAAARAILDLSLTHGTMNFCDAVMPWLSTIAPQESTVDDAPLCHGFLDLLLRREAAPTASFWQEHHDRQAGFVVNIAAFCGQGSFDGAAYLTALRLICSALRDLHKRHAHQFNGELPLFDATPLLEPLQNQDADAGLVQHAGTILITNLDAALAALGFDYDSETGRDAACYIAWLTTSVARQDTGPVPLPPVSCPIPALAQIGEMIRDEVDHADTSLPTLPVIETGFSSPGPVDSILGVEACGFAPIFSPLTDYGALRESTLARLSHKGYTPETALAAALAGETPLQQPAVSAHVAMHRALTGFVDRMPARPDPSLTLCPQTHLERGQRRSLPHRSNGVSKRAAIGGQRLYLRTGEFEDGSLGEVTISTVKGSSMVKGLVDGLNHAISIGLQYGVPLEVFVDQFAYGRYGVGGTVEGESSTRYATSLTDFVFRSLSEAYLGTALPDAGPEPEFDELSGEDPLLPFSEDDATAAFGAGAHGHRLRVV